MSARLSVHRREDARSHGVDHAGFGCFEDAQTRRAARFHLSSGPGERFLNLRDIRRGPGDTSRRCGAKKCSAVMDIIHDLSLAQIVPTILPQTDIHAQLSASSVTNLG